MENSKVAILSSDNNAEGHVVIDNVFLASYLPSAPSDFVKVFLYGLYIATSDENAAAADFARVLGMPAEKIIEAFAYWEEFGLVTLLRSEPLQIAYNPIKPYYHTRKYKPSEFTHFNKQIQEILNKKMLLPNEFNEMYRIIKEWRMTPEALIMVADYCVKTYLFPNEKNGGVAYVLQVARDWAKRGIRTIADVDEHITLLQSKSPELSEVFRALKLRRDGNPDDRQLYIKWTRDLNFPHASIIFTAKKLSKSRPGTMQRLDERLLELYKMGITTTAAIDEFEDYKANMLNLAKETVRILGLYIENLDYFIETYFTNWTNYGFSPDTIIKVAKDCSKAGIRTLEGLNSVLSGFYQKGLVSENAIDNHYSTRTKRDDEIKGLFFELGLERNITQSDRTFYSQWTDKWQLNSGLILQAANTAKDKGNPVAYLNAILSEYFNKGIKTLEEAKTLVAIADKPTAATQQAKPKASKIIRHEYTKEQLQSMLVDNLDDFK